jgi:amino acid adenylation domain-containing protein/non-ribosomal peptide synthase protein (TIGR01720 family)
LSGWWKKTIFPYDYKRAGGGERRLAEVAFKISGELFDRLMRIANHSDVRLHIILVTGLGALLHKYTDDGDVMMGTSIYKQELEGEFINTILPLRAQLHESMTFKEWLMQMSRTVLGAVENRNFPIEVLLFRLGVPFSPDEDFPLFDVAVLLENIHDKRHIRRIRNNLTFCFLRKGRSLQGLVEYNAILYDGETIARLIGHVIRVLWQFLSAVHLKISAVDILSEQEKNQVVYDFNHPDTDEYSTAGDGEGPTIHRRLEKQAERRPDSIALVGPADGGRPGAEMSLSYRELNERCGRLAHLLQAKGVHRDVVAAVLMERSLEMVVGIIGVLKAGAAYLPIDSGCPQVRVQFMLTDSGAHLLLVDSSTKVRVKGGLETISLPSAFAAPTSTSTLAGSSSLAYVVYTSGSTGRPKGVLVRHKGVVNLLSYHRKVFAENPGSLMSQVASPAFDAMAFEVWPCLASGGKLVMAPNEIAADPVRLQEWLIKKAITMTFQSTLIGEKLLRLEWPSEGVALRALRIAGDRLTTYPAKKYPFRLYNLYGPTEDTVWTSWLELDADNRWGPSPPIGKPVGNHQVYILGADRGLLPIGMPGELCIGGEGLAVGYMNRPELSAEKFNKNPLFPPDRMYRTGDRARWLADGNIEFIGRIDHQVKIRGYRIEVGEIENRLLQHQAVKEAVVLARENEAGERFLCAYIVADGGPYGSMADSEGLREYLSSVLPFYMIPAHFVKLPAFPLTVAGKVDRQALSTSVSAEGIDTYAPPRNEKESRLAEICSDVLGVERVGIGDNFFELGLDSIKAIQISAGLRKDRLKVEVRDIFTYPFIKQLARYVRPEERMIEQAAVSGEMALTPIQHWFFALDFAEKHHYNISLMLYRREGFDQEILKRVFHKIVAHHDALRMVYEIRPGRIIQRNRLPEGKMVDFKVMNLKARSDPDIAAAVESAATGLQKSIRLETGPLVKLGLFKTVRGDHLLIVVHHLVADGISLRILLEDFRLGYRQAERGEKIQFQEKTDSYKHWAEKLWEYAQRPEAVRELEYWKGVVDGAEPLPGDRNRGQAGTTAAREAVTIQLEQGETELLLTKVNRAYDTEINDILLTALGLAVKECAGLERVMVQVEGHGREPIVENVDVSRTVGWFISKYPVLLEMSKVDDLAAQIKFIKEILRQVPNRGVGYGILKYLTPAEKKGGIHFDIEAPINFNYLGQFGQEKAGSGEGETPLFTLSKMPRGESIGRNMDNRALLEVGGVIVGGQLSLTIAYHRREYRRQTIQHLAQAFRANLVKIIRLCTV